MAATSLGRGVIPNTETSHSQVALLCVQHLSVLLQSAALNAIRCVLSEQTFRSMNALLIEYCVTLPIRVDNDDGDSVNPVWCFLENIRDPSNPSSGCSADTTWSPKDGRFWSAEACNGLPPLDTDNILIAVSCLTFLS